MLNLHLVELKIREVNTRNGVAQCWNFFADGKWYSTFVGDWNSNWKTGDTIELADDQIKMTEKNGKVYWNVYAPKTPQNASVSPTASGNATNALKDIYTLLQAVHQEIKAVYRLVESTPLAGGDTKLGEPAPVTTFTDGTPLPDELSF